MEIDKVPSQDTLFIAGDLSAKVGRVIQHSQVGSKFGLGDTNERGEKLIIFCVENELFSTNTYFQQRKRRILRALRVIVPVVRLSEADLGAVSRTPDHIRVHI